MSTSGSPLADTRGGLFRFCVHWSRRDAAALAAWAAEARPDVQWAEWLRGQGLAPLAFYRLRKDGLLAQLRRDVMDALRASYYAVIAHHAMLSAALCDLLHHSQNPKPIASS